MALDPSTLLSRTTAGDAELSTPTNGLSLGQRKVLTYLEAPQALEELIAQRALDAGKLDRDLSKLAALGLIAINGQRSPLASEAVVIGPVRRSPMLRWLVPLLLLVGGVIAWFGISGIASRKPATTAISVAASAAAPTAETAANGTSAVSGPAPGIADPRTVLIDATAGRNLSAALDARQGELRAAAAGARAAPVAPGAIARTPAASSPTESLPANAATRARPFASPASGTATNTPGAAATPAPIAAAPSLGAAVPATQRADVASVRNAADASVQGHAGQPAEARDDNDGKGEPARAAGPLQNNVAPNNAVLPNNAAQPTRAVPSGIASAPTNAAAAGSAATAPSATAGALASTPPVTLAMVAPSSADTHLKPLQKLMPLTRETPEFPREALSRGIESGTVKARLSVDALGKVTAVSIIDARPTRVFDRAVTQALSHWTFAAGDASRSTEVEIAFKRD